MKSCWMALNGEGIWTHIIKHKYLKDWPMDDRLRHQDFTVQGTSYIWNGFIQSLTWITSNLRWKVGDGKRIRIGVDHLAGLNSIFVLQEGLRIYL